MVHYSVLLEDDYIIAEPGKPTHPDMLDDSENDSNFNENGEEDEDSEELDQE